MFEQLECIIHIATLISPYIILLLTFYYQSKIRKKDKQAKIAISGFCPKERKLIVGEYFNTDIEISAGNNEHSKIEIFVNNIGSTPISNVLVKVKIPNPNKTYDYYNVIGSNTPLNTSFIDEIYINEVTDKKIKYKLIKKDSKVKIIEGTHERTYRIDPIISGDKVGVQLSRSEELYIQYIRFMEQQRFAYININKEKDENKHMYVNAYTGGEHINSKEIIYNGFILKIEFDDYLGKRKEEEFYLGLFIGNKKPYLLGLHNPDSGGFSEGEWSLQILSEEERKKIKKLTKNL